MQFKAFRSFSSPQRCEITLFYIKESLNLSLILRINLSHQWHVLQYYPIFVVLVFYPQFTGLAA